MRWCEANRVDYVFGLARNSRLEAALGNQAVEAKRLCMASGRPARVFRDFRYRTLDSWSRERRVVGKAGTRRTAPILALSSPRSDTPVSPILAPSTRTSLRPRRGREPHRRAVRTVRRSRLLRHHGGQPAAHVVLGHGLCAGRHVTPCRSALYPVRRRLGADHSSQAPQAWRSGAHQCQDASTSRSPRAAPTRPSSNWLTSISVRSAPPDGHHAEMPRIDPSSHDTRRHTHALSEERRHQTRRARTRCQPQGLCPCRTPQQRKSRRQHAAQRTEASKV